MKYKNSTWSFSCNFVRLNFSRLRIVPLISTETISGDSTFFWFNNSTTNASWKVTVFDETGVQVGSSDNYTGIGLLSFNYEGIYSVQLQNNGGYSSFDNLNVSVVEASAPATLGLLSLSLVGLGVAGRRKK